MTSEVNTNKIVITEVGCYIYVELESARTTPYLRDGWNPLQ